ncbi:MAG: PqqD family protein [Planctomycetota bacterium]
MENVMDSHINKIEDDVAWDRIEEEIFIILTRNDEEKVYKLNKTAGFLWENCDGRKTVKELIDELTRKYDVDEKKAIDDTKKFIDQMKKLNLINLYK